VGLLSGAKGVAPALSQKKKLFAAEEEVEVEELSKVELLEEV
jgi:hypothetical protein